MRSLIAALTAVFALSFCSAFAAEQSETASVRRYKYVEAELSLATKDKFYVVFDLEKSQVLLKARASVFKAWPIENLKQFGEAIPLEVLPLQKRSLGSESLRVRIQPPEPEKEESESVVDGKAKKQDGKTTKEEKAKVAEAVTAPKYDALEIGAMPFNYDLTFAKNLTVRVSADDPKEEKSFFDRLSADAKETYRLYKLKKSGEEYTLLTLKMAQADAKALYWALGDSMNAIFWVSNP